MNTLQDYTQLKYCIQILYENNGGEGGGTLNQGVSSPKMEANR
jgi:hypothetical protein